MLPFQSACLEHCRTTNSPKSYCHLCQIGGCGYWSRPSVSIKRNHCFLRRIELFWRPCCFAWALGVGWWILRDALIKACIPFVCRICIVNSNQHSCLRFFFFFFSGQSSRFQVLNRCPVANHYINVFSKDAFQRLVNLATCNWLFQFTISTPLSFSSSFFLFR